MAKAKTLDEQILNVLSRRLSDPTPRPMHATAAEPGIFASAAAAAKAAAQQCLALGLLRQDGERRKGKKLVPLYTITPQGVAYLLERAEGPKLLGATLDAVERTARAVSECARSMEIVGRQLSELRQVVQQAAARTDPAELAARVLSADSRTGAGDSPAIAATINGFVHDQRARRSPQPCSLADLFRHVAARYSGLTIGQLHDAVRQLASDRRLRLLPFTQAMYQLSEPEYALIVGREVMYYVEAL